MGVSHFKEKWIIYFEEQKNENNKSDNYPHSFIIYL
jgi:hypothetical protein